MVSLSPFSAEICTSEVRLGEFGVYDLRLKGSACELGTALEPVNANLALLYWSVQPNADLIRS